MHLVLILALCVSHRQVNIWSYGSRKLIHSIETGHSANIFCTKFMPETGDDIVVSGAGDAEVYHSWFPHCRMRPELSERHYRIKRFKHLLHSK